MSTYETHELELLRSDGDPRSWPPVTTSDTPEPRGCYVTVKLDEETSVQWRVKIGVHIAKYLKLPGTRH